MVLHAHRCLVSSWSSHRDNIFLNEMVRPMCTEYMQCFWFLMGWNALEISPGLTEIKVQAPSWHTLGERITKPYLLEMVSGGSLNGPDFSELLICFYTEGSVLVVKVHLILEMVYLWWPSQEWITATQLIRDSRAVWDEATMFFIGQLGKVLKRLSEKIREKPNCWFFRIQIPGLNWDPHGGKWSFSPHRKPEIASRHFLDFWVFPSTVLCGISLSHQQR